MNTALFCLVLPLFSLLAACGDSSSQPSSTPDPAPTVADAVADAETSVSKFAVLFNPDYVKAFNKVPFGIYSAKSTAGDVRILLEASPSATSTGSMTVALKCQNGRIAGVQVKADVLLTISSSTNIIRVLEFKGDGTGACQIQAFPSPGYIGEINRMASKLVFLPAEIPFSVPNVVLPTEYTQ